MAAIFSYSRALFLPVFALVSATALPAQLRFVDVAAEVGLDYVHGYLDSKGNPVPIEELGAVQNLVGGAATGDYDGDGFVDLYVAVGSRGPNRLLRNDRKGSFVRAEVQAGVALTGSRLSGPTFADVDGDGWLDIFTGVIGGGTRLLMGSADGSFRDASAASGIVVNAPLAISSAFGDGDADGDLDLLVAQWIGNTRPGESLNHYWANDGRGRFQPKGDTAGLVIRSQLQRGFQWYWTFTPNFADINDDGVVDVLFASDFGTSQVFLAEEPGRFVDATTPVISDENGMGAAIGDYDNDGDLDWFVSSITDPSGVPHAEWGASGNRLYRNRGDGTFEDVTDEAGVRQGYWGWAACFADFDNDGDLDLFHVNGRYGLEPDAYPKFFGKPSLLYRNDGGRFVEVAQPAGVGDPDEGRGASCFDYDRDGDVDIFVANVGQSPRLYRNDTADAGGFLNIKLLGCHPNSEAIGARVSIETATLGAQMRELRAGSNYISQDPAEAHFGLGADEHVRSIAIRWPRSGVTHFGETAADQWLRIPENGGDSNCDGRFSAADIVAAVAQIGTGRQCPDADIDGSGEVEAADLHRTASKPFGPNANPACRPERVATTLPVAQ